MGNANYTHCLGERAAHVANLINERRGWVQSMQRREENIQQIYNDCMEILKAMPKFDLNTYCNMVTAKGYNIQTKSDEKGKVRGYCIRKGNSIYKSSELGQGRKLMPSKIEATWAKLHNQDKQTFATVNSQTNEQSNSQDKQPVINNGGESDTNAIASIHHYDIPVDGKTYRVDIPQGILSTLVEEFGKFNMPEENDKVANIAKVAFLLFAQYLDAATSMAASSGGGGSPGTGWGKDKDEDDRDWARRCARMAHWLCKPVKKAMKR